jgi:hypothetical protein
VTHPPGAVCSAGVTDADDPVHSQIIGGFDREGTLWVLSLFAIGGVALGALLPLLASWAADVPWVPFRGPLELLGSFDERWLVWGRPALGLLGGLGFGIWIIVDSPVLEVGHDLIQVRRRGQVDRVIERSKVDAVYPRGSRIIVETSSGRKLFEGDIEGDRSAIRAAFVDRGYPWEGARS